MVGVVLIAAGVVMLRASRDTCPVRGPRALRAQLGARTVVAGVATIGAYGLLLLALERAAAAPVAAHPACA